jgi:type 2 lantibiotic biosynthesis protein LanM
VRVIIRATQIYSVLLSESFHPDVLRNALDRDRLFDRLWIGIDQNPNLARVIPSERDDLWQGDIPMFTTGAGSRDLWDGAGRKLPDFFEESGLTLVQRRLRQFGDKDLDRQLWVVRASLASVVLGGDRAPLPPYPMTAGHSGVDCERLLAAARAVGDCLEERAIRGPEGDASWINLALVNDRYWSIRPLGVDLYDGLPGVALFLGYLGQLTGEERYTDLARAALEATRPTIRQLGASMTGIGAFDGWGGVIYALAHLGRLWNQPELFREAEVLAGRLPALIEDDKTFDVIAGAAGCIGALLTLYRVAPSEQTLASARQCGDHLLARAQSMPQGVGWPSPMPANGPLTGFSHGTAGIAWALLELAEVSGDSRYRRTALEALAYERSLFNAQEGNWPDLRLDEQAPNQGSEGGAPECGMAWCHGAPGIGLGRLGILRHVDDAMIREEIEIALRTTLAQGFGHNHTLCHGDLGNLELVLEAGEVLEDPHWHAERDRLAAIILESTRRDGWRCAIPFNVETPGLMTGLAGIGYGLLRLADPGQVPSVLLLAPPF